jgi:hypothetical protein
MDYQQEWVTFLKWKVEYLERNLPSYLTSWILTAVLTIILGGGGVLSVFQWLVGKMPVGGVWGTILLILVVWFSLWYWWIRRIQRERKENKEERYCLVKLIALIVGKQIDTEDKAYEGYQKRCRPKDFDKWCSQIRKSP